MKRTVKAWGNDRAWNLIVSPAIKKVEKERGIRILFDTYGNEFAVLEEVERRIQTYTVPKKRAGK